MSCRHETFVGISWRKSAAKKEMTATEIEKNYNTVENQKDYENKLKILGFHR